MPRNHIASVDECASICAAKCAEMNSHKDLVRAESGDRSGVDFDPTIAYEIVDRGVAGVLRDLLCLLGNDRRGVHTKVRVNLGAHSLAGRWICWAGGRR
jgi:hypothetical protein